MAKVVAVNVSEKKGTIKHAVEEVEMKEDFGIVPKPIATVKLQ